MKISYIITTIRPPEMAIKTIASIKNQGVHEHEILIISPIIQFKNTFQSIDNVFFIEDKENNGSVSANNLGCKLSNGDWLSFLPDDFFLKNIDINEFKNFLSGSEMNKKTFKMFSYHTYSAHKITGAYKTPIEEPYQIMHFPCVARETIDSKLSGVIFNHRFQHHFCDHWLGFYASLHEQYEPYNYSKFKQPSSPEFINLHSNQQFTNSNFTNSDLQILIKLYLKFKENPEISYNY